MALPATDNFNRADGGLGGNWTTLGALGAPAIVSNQVQPTTAGTDAGAWWNADTFPGDHYSQIKVVTANAATDRAVEAVVRGQSGGTSNFYAAGVRGPLGASATFEIRKNIAGTTTILSTATKTVNANDIIKCEVIGQTLNAYVNGVVQATAASAASLTGGAPGVFVFSDTPPATDAQLDDWQGGAVEPSGSAMPFIGGPIPLLPGPWVDGMPLAYQQPGDTTIFAAANTLLEPAPATMTFTGQGPTVDSVLNPVNGTMVFTGQTSPVNSALMPANGTMVFTAQTATLASVLNPAPGTMVFTGQTAREDVVLNPVNGTMVFNGQTGTVNVGTLLNPANATMVFTGQAPALASVVNPLNATMTFTGQTPAIASVLNPANGTMIFTGQAPRLDSKLNPLNASMVFNGQTPALASVLNPSNATMSFTGQVPTVTVGGDIVLNPGNATMVFTGQTGTVSVSSPPGGSFQLIFLKESGQMAKRIDAAGRMYEELGG